MSTESQQLFPPELPKGIDWRKLSRYLAEESPIWEWREIERAMDRQPEFRNFVHSLRKIWSIQPESDVKITDPERAWEKVSLRRKELPTVGERKELEQSLWGRYGFRVAVVLLALVGTSFLALQFLDRSRSTAEEVAAMREVSTDRGQRAKVRFADGTTAMLNSSTSIRFREKFSQEMREVFLKGEAFFEVTTVLDSTGTSEQGFLPFVVYAGSAVIRVLGTEFNVKAWPDDENIEVVVARGVVSVRSPEKGEDEAVVLKRGEMSSVRQGTAPSPPVRVDLDRSLSWLDGRIVFHNTSFRDVLRSLERHYGLVCTVADEQLHSMTLTATFKGESVSEILKIIGISMNITYQKSGEKVTFYPKRRRSA